jgi:hypothetical protein
VTCAVLSYFRITAMFYVFRIFSSAALIATSVFSNVYFPLFFFFCTAGFVSVVSIATNKTYPDLGTVSMASSIKNNMLDVPEKDSITKCKMLRMFSFPVIINKTSC